MRRLLLAASAAVFLCWAVNALAGAFPDGPGGPNIAVVNSSSLPDKTLAADVVVFQQYADQVCQAWHCTANLYFAGSSNTGVRDARDWIFYVNDTSTVSDAIGYHEELNGRVLAYVSVKTAHDYRLSWPSVFTHELGEALVDPEAEAADQIDQNLSNASFVMREIADPVQGRSYRLGGLLVSDFVYRSWFMPDGQPPYDAARVLRAPLTLYRNSYESVYRNGSWTQPNTFTGLARNWDRFGPMTRPSP